MKAPLGLSLGKVIYVLQPSRKELLKTLRGSYPPSVNPRSYIIYTQLSNYNML